MKKCLTRKDDSSGLEMWGPSLDTPTSTYALESFSALARWCLGPGSRWGTLGRSTGGLMCSQTPRHHVLRHRSVLSSCGSLVVPPEPRITSGPELRRSTAEIKLACCAACCGCPRTSKVPQSWFFLPVPTQLHSPKHSIASEAFNWVPFYCLLLSRSRRQDMEAWVGQQSLRHLRCTLPAQSFGIGVVKLLRSHKDLARARM